MVAVNEADRAYLVTCFRFSFFFQAEDGIRDWSVTGVQTCALPILLAGAMAAVDRCSDQTHQGQVSEIHLEARLAQRCLVICHHRRGGLRFLPGLVAGKDALRAWLLQSDIRNRSAKHAGQPAHSEKTAYQTPPGHSRGLLRA